jgi:hypothetical protein
MTDYYAILGLEKSVPLGDIKAAYRVLAKKYHPDVNKSAEAARQMQAVNEAYETLGDPIKRAEYDQIREMGGGSDQVASEKHVHVGCKKCGKVDSTLRVSTFTTVWSFVFFSTYRGWSQILCAKCRVCESLKFNLQVLFFGWWGIPWGIIWTIVFFIKNSMGGHQPAENNAVLLATVGKNLIDAGDYIEAEKALIESLKLKDNEYVQDLLRTAKSRAGFKKEKNHLEKMARFESHPLVYNSILLILVLASFLFTLKVYSSQLNLQLSKKELSQEEKAEKKIKEQEAKDFGLDLLQDENRKKEIHDSNTRGMLHQTLIENLFAKINILRGDRWNLPIHLGDSREHVYQVLGDPTDNSDKFVAAIEHGQQGARDNHKYWMDKGIVIRFKDDVVNSITVSGYQCVPKVNKSTIVYGIYSTDDARTLIAKLGLPYLPNLTNSNPEFGFSQAEFEWRIGKLRITRSILSIEGTDDFKKKYPIGYPWGGVHIEDLSPIQHEEKNREEDAKIKNEKVKLSGKQISSKEIFERYKDRIYLVISYDSQGNETTFGTGFLSEDLKIVTNYHVVEDARTIKVKSLYVGSDETQVRVLSYSKELDWVILDLGVFGDKKGPFPQVQYSEKVETGEPVTVIGNPEGLTGSLSTGVVSSTRDVNGSSWVQITAPVSHGSSGSPVFDSTGHWIGLATLSLSEGQNLNIATPSKPIIEQIKSLNKEQSNSMQIFKYVKLPLKEDYTEALLKLGLGKEEAIEGIKSLLSIYPDPEDQSNLLGHLALAYGNNRIKEKLEIYNKQIALNLKGDYMPYISKADILYILENQQPKIDTTESHSYYKKGIEMAKYAITKDFDEAKKEHEKDIYPNMLAKIKKTNEDTFQQQIKNLQLQHAYDVFKIGYSYWMMDDYKNAEAWLEKSKQMKPALSKIADPILTKIHAIKGN